MATVQELIKAAFRKVGAISTGQTPSDGELQDALDDLNRMLETWSTREILTYVSTSENFSMVAGTASYTMGSSGTASSTRAKKILDAFVRDSSNYDHSVRIIGEGEYNAVKSKTTQSRPNRLFYDPEYPLGVINLYPVPNAAETMYIESQKLLHTAFTALTTTVSLPGEYEEAIIYNLAVRLAPEHELEVPKLVGAIAVSSLSNIITLNAANKVEPVSLDPAITGGGRLYDINTDE